MLAKVFVSNFCVPQSLEAQMPMYWVPVLKSLYNFVRSVSQGPTIRVPGLLGNRSMQSKRSNKSKHPKAPKLDEGR